jgi:hypothetical protein
MLSPAFVFSASGIHTRRVHGGRGEELGQVVTRPILESTFCTVKPGLGGRDG